MRSETKTSQQLYYSFCFTVPLGSIPEIPAETCKEIKASEFGQAVSGDYWFDSVLPGKIILLPCNMETEGQWLYESVKHRLRVMFTLYRIAFSWRLEKSSGIAWTALSILSFQSSFYLFTSATVRRPVHTTPKCATEPITYVMLQFAPLPNSRLDQVTF